MSMPETPKDLEDDVDVENALLQSIALEEMALAHVINGEGKKIEKIANLIDDGRCGCDDENVENVLDLQDSVNDTLKNTIKKEMLLQFKLEDVLDGDLSKKHGKHDK